LGIEAREKVHYRFIFASGTPSAFVDWRSSNKTPRAGSAAKSVIRMASRRSTNSASRVGWVPRRAIPPLRAGAGLKRARRDPRRDPGAPAIRLGIQSDNQATSSRDRFSSKAASQSNTPAPVGGEVINGGKIVRHEFRVVKGFPLDHSRCERGQYSPNGDAESAHARLTGPFSSVTRSAIAGSGCTGRSPRNVHGGWLRTALVIQPTRYPNIQAGAK